MIFDNAFIENASDIVADNVTTLPQSPTPNSMVYLLEQDGSFVPGLYIYNELQTWVFLSNSDPVTDPV